jgi:hypothetical protein
MLLMVIDLIGASSCKRTRSIMANFPWIALPNTVGNIPIAVFLHLDFLSHGYGLRLRSALDWLSEAPWVPRGLHEAPWVERSPVG